MADIDDMVRSVRPLASLRVLLEAAIEVADHEYDDKRTYEASQLVTAMRRAAGAVEVYEAWLLTERKS